MTARYDPLHPNGRCTCAGEGWCAWCESPHGLEPKGRVQRFAERVLGWFPTKRIMSASSYLNNKDSPYLTRHKVLDLGKRAIRVYVHHFHRSDEDPELHSHPWKWAVAFVLKGGYIEYRLVTQVSADHPIVQYVAGMHRRAGAIVVLSEYDFHRVELYERESWSLFIVGPESERGWFFKDQRTGVITDWRTFLRRKAGAGPEREFAKYE